MQPRVTDIIMLITPATLSNRVHVKQRTRAAHVSAICAAPTHWLRSVQRSETKCAEGKKQKRKKEKNNDLEGKKNRGSPRESERVNALAAFVRTGYRQWYRCSRWIDLLLSTKLPNTCFFRNWHQTLDGETYTYRMCVWRTMKIINFQLISKLN